jgi:mediator of RNA polymerase II transcription subunit 31
LEAGLAQSRFFSDEAFIQYLEYLQYWKEPEYAKYIVYVPTIEGRV